MNWRAFPKLRGKQYLGLPQFETRKRRHDLCLRMV